MPHKYVFGLMVLQAKNTRQDEAKIEVSEQVPLSQDDRIKVRGRIYVYNVLAILYCYVLMYRFT